jgi:hypothetical protein
MASVRKRTWKSGGKVRIVWIADYFDQGGKRHIKSFKTKKEADAQGWPPAATAPQGAAWP